MLKLLLFNCVITIDVSCNKFFTSTAFKLCAVDGLCLNQAKPLALSSKIKLFFNRGVTKALVETNAGLPVR